MRPRTTVLKLRPPSTSCSRQNKIFDQQISLHPARIVWGRAERLKDLSFLVQAVLAASISSKHSRGENKCSISQTKTRFFCGWSKEAISFQADSDHLLLARKACKRPPKKQLRPHSRWRHLSALEIRVKLHVQKTFWEEEREEEGIIWFNCSLGVLFHLPPCYPERSRCMLCTTKRLAPKMSCVASCVQQKHKHNNSKLSCNVVGFKDRIFFCSVESSEQKFVCSEDVRAQKGKR